MSNSSSVLEKLCAVFFGWPEVTRADTGHAVTASPPENGYTAFARSALDTQNAQHSAIGPSYRQQLLLAIADQPT